jgi:hypothetical protein
LEFESEHKLASAAIAGVTALCGALARTGALAKADVVAVFDDMAKQLHGDPIADAFRARLRELEERALAITAEAPPRG